LIDTSTKRVVSYGTEYAKPGGEALRELVDAPGHALRDLERVGARRQEDADQRRRLAVEAAVELVVLAAELDARDLVEAHRRAVGARAHDDLAELLRVGEAALGGDRVDEVLRRADRRRADLAGRELRVLLVDRRDDVAGRELELREAVGLEPDPHRVVLRAEDLHVGRAGQPLQLVEDVERDVVRDEEVVLAAVGRVEREHLQERARAALDRDALAAHLERQPRFDLLGAVADVDRGLVDVGADLERHLDLHEPVRRRVRAHVDHAGHAVDRVLERRGDGLLDDLGGGARVDRLHGDDRRRDLGYCAIGSTRIDARPASTRKIEMTAAKIGRSMKKREIMTGRP
jgi:hypothetical protein